MGVRFPSVPPMSKKITQTSDEEFIALLKKAAKNCKAAAETMEANYQKGMQSIIDFWKDK
jgi:hypothetical protein